MQLTKCGVSVPMQHSRNKHPLRTDARFRDAMETAIESYIMKGVHDKLFPVVCQANERSDQELLQKIRLLSGVSGDQLGVREDFCCPLPAAKVELANINGFKTPQEKLLCLKTTLDLINEGIKSHIMDRRLPLDGGMPCIASDDLLPILVTVIVEAKCIHLASNLFYIENFYFSKSSVNDLSFSLVTFQAAINYLLSTDFSYLTRNKQPQTSNGQQVGEVRTASPGSVLPDPGATSRFDRKLDSIVRMLETSTSELGKISHSSVQQQQKQQQSKKQQRGGTFVSSSRTVPANVIPLQDTSLRKNQLGDFLSALQSDSFHSSYGKQT